MPCSIVANKLPRALLVCAALLGGTLLARPVSAQTHTLAESLFRDAREAMKAGDPERACPSFAESYRLDPAFGTLFNLGVCEEERGKLASAWAAFRKLIDVAPPDDERVLEARTRLGTLEPRVPRLRIVVLEPLAPGHALELDGVVLGPGALEEALRVDPGKHAIRLVAAGGVLRSTELDVAVGATLTYEVEPFAPSPVAAPRVPRRSAPPAAAPRRDERAAASGSKVPAYTAFGLGGAGVAASLVLGAVALRANEVVKTHCPRLYCDAEGMSAGDRGAKAASLSTASAVAGLVGLAVGGVLLFRASDDSTRVMARGSNVHLEGTF